MISGSSATVVENTKSSNSTLLQGKKIKRYGKFILTCVFIHTIKSRTDVSDNAKFTAATDAIARLDKTKDIEEIYDELLKLLKIETPEGLLSYLFYIYEPSPEDLIYKTFNTFCGIRSLDHVNDWFDNYRLDGICASHNLVMYHDFDKKGIYTVERSAPHDIKRDVKIDFEKTKRLLVGSLRSFIISNNLYQSNENYTIPETFKELDAETICDECYIHYPFFYGGCHGWDVVFGEKSLSIKELYDFTTRYPKAIVGYIFNTSTYQSGSGQHWTAVCFKNRKCYLVCSEASDFSAYMEYKDSEKTITFNQILNQYSFGLEYNPTAIQRDSHSCGMFSALSLYLMICYDCDIRKVVEKIGINGQEISENKTIIDYIKILAGK